MIGKRFYKWTVIEKAVSKKSKPGGLSWSRWFCQCDCGNVRVVPGYILRKGASKGCPTCKIKTIHGLSRNRFYGTWRNMMERCYDPSNKIFHHYGGRGIEVCEEWKDLTKFINWCEAQNPAPGLTMDRYPDNNGNYEPGNVRWATAAEQSRNTRANTIVNHNGTEYTITDFVNQFAVVTRRAFYTRLNKGWTIEDAAFTPSTSPFKGKPK